MTQRTLAGLLAVPLLVALWFQVLREPLPYVIYAPGLTVDVLGTTDGEESGTQIIEVAGAETFHDDGQLRLTTVLVTQPESDVNLFQLLRAWIDSDEAVYPFDAVYGPDETDESRDEEGASQMATSQDDAIAVALTELGYDVNRGAVVARIIEGSPADGELEVDDRLLTINGTPVTSVEEAGLAVFDAPVDEPVELRILRGEEQQTLSITREEVEGELRLGFVMRNDYEFPVEVTVGVDPAIGGPSAGLMFSLAIYDTLTEGSMTGGASVAGTGTITSDGRVGAIGGIDQKIAGAREDGAELFLVPADNCDDAVESPHGDMRLTRVATMTEAVDAIEDWAADPDADLPQCTAETGDAHE
ncbi:MAG: YlbL family protein [Nocardioides sp.]